MKIQRLLVLLVPLLLTACSSLGSRAPAGVDLTGIWDLNTTRSDSPRNLLSHMTHREARHHRRFGDQDGPGRGERGPGGIGRGPGGGFPLAESGRGYGAGLMRRSLLSELGAHELDMEQRKGAMRIEYDRKDVEIYHWGEQSSRRNPWEPPSGWKGHKFVITTRGRRGLSLERNFTLSGDQKTLTVETRIGKKTMMQQYDLNEAATAHVYGAK